MNITARTVQWFISLGSLSIVITATSYSTIVTLRWAIDPAPVDAALMLGLFFTFVVGHLAIVPLTVLRR